MLALAWRRLQLFAGALHAAARSGSRHILRDLAPIWARRIARRGRRRVARLAGSLGIIGLWRTFRIRSALRAGTFYSFLFRRAQRQSKLIARFAKPLADPAWRLATSDLAGNYFLLSARADARGLRRLSRLMLGIARRVHLAILGIELSSGHTQRAMQLSRTLNLMFRKIVRSRERPSCNLYFEAMFRTMHFKRIVREVPELETINDHHLNHQIGVAHLYALNAETAIAFLRRAIEIHDGSYIDYRMLGRAYLLKSDFDRAKAAFKRSVQLQPKTVMAHQNYSGRYDVSAYVPKKFELRQAGELLIYDNLGQFAEDLFLQGRFHESFRHYQLMLDYQRQIAIRRQVPRYLIDRLAAAHNDFDPELPLRLLPYEWVIQFGHIGLLDIYMKMAKLGMYPKANYVLLAPASKVANDAYLRYWERYYTIVRDPELVDELFPYQRIVGDNFMAYPSDTGEAEPWTRAGARAQVQWAAEKRAPLLALSPEDHVLGLQKLPELGVPEDAWYVGLHVREGGFYVEASSGMSTHRNASIDDYAGAIREITDRGGWVIRLGDSSMRPMAPMEHVVDYAVGKHKSPEMDIFLLATSRFVIGTTSGLTTACLSFGRPMLLVNCISNDWQLWTDKTDFILKRLRDKRSGRYLSLSETYRQPVQGYLINNVVTNRQGYVIEPNSAFEIAEATKYKLDCLDGSVSKPERSHPALAAYCSQMTENPYMFGAADPVLSFLEQHVSLLGGAIALRSAA